MCVYFGFGKQSSNCQRIVLCSHVESREPTLSHSHTQAQSARSTKARHAARSHIALGMYICFGFDKNSATSIEFFSAA